MNTYVIFRRKGWRSAEELQAAAAARSKEVGENMSGDIRWIRSYVVGESAGAVGTVCIYQASSPEAIRRHAAAANLPLDEIVEAVDTVVLGPDRVTVAS